VRRANRCRSRADEFVDQCPYGARCSICGGLILSHARAAARDGRWSHLSCADAVRCLLPQGARDAANDEGQWPWV
jgi:hypothetical protein